MANICMSLFSELFNFPVFAQSAKLNNKKREYRIQTMELETVLSFEWTMILLFLE